jgi:hypothetical protein
MKKFTEEQIEKLDSILLKFQKDLRKLGIDGLEVEISESTFYSEFYKRKLPQTKFNVKFNRNHHILYEE